MRRRDLLTLGATGLAAPALGSSAAAVDMLGQAVVLTRPPRRILLAEASDLIPLALAHEDPLALIAGWSAAERLGGNGLLQALQSRHPEAAAIPWVGGMAADSFSLERALDLRPDLVVLTAYQEPGLADGPLTRAFRRAGAAVVFSTAPGDGDADHARRLRLFGAIAGRPDRAEAFLSFSAARRAEIGAALQGATPTSVFVHFYADPGAPCCMTTGLPRWQRFLRATGGIAVPPLSSLAQIAVSPEDILLVQPEVVVAARTLIPPADRASADSFALASLRQRPGLQGLHAVARQRLHGVWAGLGEQPIDLLLIAAMAHWLHPSRIPAALPGELLTVLRRDFIAVPLEGRFWSDLHG
ncbi:ABC transporter substrate-binding protein [Roseomonas sp. USHLN139]|uniref:ABC transporter substrate-binding protein n=1 Tax=Roseomonas sp. USHLN139 TaxID=3081298 RepID=UPI003B01A63E